MAELCDAHAALGISYAGMCTHTRTHAHILHYGSYAEYVSRLMSQLEEVILSQET
jgi:hypothetical protein